MIISFRDKNTEALFHGDKRIYKFPIELARIAFRKLDILNTAHILQDLQSPPGNRLEKLSGNYAGFHSIRINDKYRIIFQWKENNAHKVSIIDYH